MSIPSQFWKRKQGTALKAPKDSTPRVKVTKKMRDDARVKLFSLRRSFRLRVDEHLEDFITAEILCPDDVIESILHDRNVFEITDETSLWQTVGGTQEYLEKHSQELLNVISGLREEFTQIHMKRMADTTAKRKQTTLERAALKAIKPAQEVDATEGSSSDDSVESEFSTSDEHDLILPVNEYIEDEISSTQFAVRQTITIHLKTSFRFSLNLILIFISQSQHLPCIDPNVNVSVDQLPISYLPHGYRIVFLVRVIRDVVDVEMFGLDYTPLEVAQLGVLVGIVRGKCAAWAAEVEFMSLELLQKDPDVRVTLRAGVTARACCKTDTLIEVVA
ncbi:uncharacterized protein BXZ73DRAFT_108816 [Epithele typhae]|uniref:uncharacterized protein n=1 Tax=Epithele typhae TaxID=378194 RepID=UPI002008D1E2|nr:uncharacterized protein BXZ73DRAFT_108816 [Epithele typhae]KAH9910557.1 hypothetical protein BXZ73DRAFT_108816 [Epithele typhae]